MFYLNNDKITVASIASESSVPSTDQSLMDSVFLSGETQQQILKFKRHINEMQNQLKQIRRTIQVFHLLLELISI